MLDIKVIRQNPDMVKQAMRNRQMDLDYSFTQMIQICTAPTKVWGILAMGSS